MKTNIKLISIVLTLSMLLGILSSCNVIFKPMAHECESKCDKCGGCKDAACTDSACADKCDCQVTPPAHTCESKCDKCGGCKDAACTEAACANKCNGHEVTPPAHTCESVCPECGGCKDAACTDSACADKCDCQVTPPAHTCESVCPECGGCKDAACAEAACADKCNCQVTPPVHNCESKCDECGGCQDVDCDDTACATKCECDKIIDSKPDFIYGKYSLNLMSFNIRTTATETNPLNNWDNRKSAVAAFINNSGADIMGLQEVRQTQYDYISANLASNYAALYFPRETGSNPEGLAFIYDKTKFEFISSEKYWLSPTPDEQSKGWGESYYRIAAVLMLKSIETGEIIKSINTHGPLDDVANTNAYQLIMDRSVNEGDPFTFLCGDFNAHPDEIGYVPVAAELQDCRVTADDDSERDYTTFNSWGGYTNETPQIIDFCFVSKGDHVDVKTYDVRQDTFGDGRLYSDHYAVQTIVEVTYQTDIPDSSEGGFDGEIDPAN